MEVYSWGCGEYGKPADMKFWNLFSFLFPTGCFEKEEAVFKNHFHCSV